MTESIGIMDIDETMKPIFKGELLLCEDNEVAQRYFKGHITRLGLYIVIAGNGQEGVDIVTARMEKGKKPFDLIFMDIQMPMMDGLEASDELMRLGNKTPIVALTANTTENDKQLYINHGILDTVSKPFTTKELWALLCKYLTPIGYENLSDNDVLNEEEKRRKKLFTNFAMRNRNTFSDICHAIETGDIKLAHRLAHTIRGLAGLMNKTRLQEAAHNVEKSLADGSTNNLSQTHMTTFKTELAAVLDELSPYIAKVTSKKKALDVEIVARLFDELKSLLDGNDASCQELVNDLTLVPDTDDLISQIEEYEFEKALETLSSLKNKLGV